MDLTIYKENIKALARTQQNSLIRLLETTDIVNQDECKVFEGFKSDVNVLKVKNSKGNYILYNSFYNPLLEANDITVNLDYTINRSLIVTVGVGLGYHLKEILKNLNEKSMLLAIEKNKLILKTLLSFVDFSEEIMNGNIFFITMEDENNNDSLYKSLAGFLNSNFLNLFSIQTLTLPILDISYIRFAKDILKYIADLRNTLEFTLGNDIDDTLQGIENQIMNLPHIIKNPGFRQFLERFKNTYKGKPAIIIASGPSLDKNIHLLKQAEGKALLLACDGSMESLEKHDIIPDVVSSVERIMLTYEAFYKGKDMPNETVLVAPAVVRPEIFNTFNNKTLSLFKNEPIADYFNDMVLDKGTVFSGSSVAHQLLGIATAVGADPVILVGQDLAYSPDGISHTSEASVKEQVSIDKVSLYVKDANGNELPTTFVWKQFKQIYEEYIRILNINCIDATEGGAFIEGTKVMCLKDVLDMYCKENLVSFRELVDSMEVNSLYIGKAYKRSLTQLIRLAKKYYLLRLKCIKSLSLNEKADRLLKKGLDTDEELNEVYDALEYTENKIVKYISKSSSLTMFFQFPISVSVRQVNLLGTNYTIDNLRDNLVIHKQLLQTIIHYCDKALILYLKGFSFLKEKAVQEVEKEWVNELKAISYPNFLIKYDT